MKPGWVEEYARSLREAVTEEERSKVTGFRPRKAWRSIVGSNLDAAIRGGHKGGSAPKRKRATDGDGSEPE